MPKAKLIIVIGQSASGKTTFVKRRFLKDNDMTLNLKPFKHTTIEDDSICLLGDYTDSRRCLGTDTLSMSIINDLIEFVKGSINKYDLIICEGDRITNAKFLQFVHDLKVEAKVYLFQCSLQESIDRRTQMGSKPSLTFVKTTQTKAQNLKPLIRQLGFELIVRDTSNKDTGMRGLL